MTNLVSAVSRTVLVGILLVARQVAAQPGPDLERKCAALSQMNIPGGRVLSSRAIEAGPYQEPAQMRPGPPETLPAYCRVEVKLTPTQDSDIRVQVWLPLATWNGRFWGVGNGGFAGYLNVRDMAIAIQRGFASVTTDTGHPLVGTEEWARGHPERVVDFAHRAIHLATVTGKQITRQFYGRPAKYSYFESCSNGGRQALMEAQRYPDDYNGIIAGAPAAHWPELIVASFGSNLAALRTAPITPAKTPALQRAVLAQCDTLDGVADNLILNPLACRVDLARLKCTGAETNECFTQPQIDALQRIYNGPSDSNGKSIYPGLLPGGEVGTMPGSGWDGWLFSEPGKQSIQADFASRFMRDFVATEPGWTVDKLVLPRDWEIAFSKYSSILSPTPDLSSFARAGGKLIVYHGWQDAAIPAKATIQFFEAMKERLGIAATDKASRLYMVPGMQHCGLGPGPWWFNPGPPARDDEPNSHMGAALQRWVEQDKAPNQIRAIRPKDPNSVFTGAKEVAVERSLPLCPYPQIVRYRGSGDFSRAESYDCVEP